jgi:hypothetical protein
VSDLPRMGEWSPENDGGKWAKGATGPASVPSSPGSNKNGFRRGRPLVTVVDCEPAKVFEIAVTFGTAAGGQLALRVRGDRRWLPGHRVVGRPPQAG